MCLTVFAPEIDWGRTNTYIESPSIRLHLFRQPSLFLRQMMEASVFVLCFWNSLFLDSKLF